MRIAYIDTETTDTQNGQIAQLSYIIEELNAKPYGKNFYFKIKSITAGASAVNGLTVEKCEELSNGSIFADYAKEIFTDLNNSVLVGHNISFDDRYIKLEFSRLRMSLNTTQVCTMKSTKELCKLPRVDGKPGYKFPKLSELIETLKIKNKTIEDWTRACFGDIGQGLHDSRYDAMCVFAAVHQLRKMGAIEI